MPPQIQSSLSVLSPSNPLWTFLFLSPPSPSTPIKSILFPFLGEILASPPHSYYLPSLDLWIIGFFWSVGESVMSNYALWWKCNIQEDKVKYQFVKHSHVKSLGTSLHDVRAQYKRSVLSAQEALAISMWLTGINDNYSVWGLEEEEYTMLPAPSLCALARECQLSPLTHIFHVGK